MKTNTAARRIVRVRFVLSILAIVTILAGEIGVGAWMVSRVGQTSSARTPTQPAISNTSIGDFAIFAR